MGVFDGVGGVLGGCSSVVVGVFGVCVFCVVVDFVVRFG